MNEEENLQIQSQIKSHYLFPVIELLLSKCEQATNNLDENVFNIEDVFKLINELKEKTSDQEISKQNKEINQLVFDVIYMLRIHLLELSKLKKLIEKFKTKYTGIIKKTFAHETDLNSLSDSDDDSFLDDIYASNYPITATGMFFPGSFMPPPFLPAIPDSIDVNMQNKNIFHNGFNTNEKMFYDQQNNYLLHLAYLANTQSSLQPQSQPPQPFQSNLSTTASSKNATVNQSTKKK